MGGKLYSTNRVNLETFLYIKGEVLEILNNEGISCAVPLWYRNKQDFGDLDVIIHYDTEKVDFDALLKKYGWDNGIKNNNVYSFPYKSFQIDLIYTQPQYFECTLDFLSYNDLGNLIGKLANSVRLKYGHKGLLYRFHPSLGNHRYDIELTKNMEHICFLLNLDYDSYLQGFDTLEEIYNFITDSTFFHPDYFNPKYQNNGKRKRDAKRRTVVYFREWLDNQSEIKNRTKKNFYYTLSSLSSLFPEFADTYLNIIDNLEFDEKTSKKLNGRLVKDITGLEGSTLGRFLNDIKTHIQDTMCLNETDTWKDIIFFSNKGEPEKIIQDYYEQHKDKYV